MWRLKASDFIKFDTDFPLFSWNDEKLILFDRTWFHQGVQDFDRKLESTNDSSTRFRRIETRSQIKKSEAVDEAFDNFLNN